MSAAPPRAAAPGIPAVVLLPGLGLSGAQMTPLVEALGDLDVRVGLLPAFGRPAPTVPLDPVALAELLVRQLEGERHTAVVLVAHSASCQVAAEAAARAPDLVAGLVLVGPTTDPRGATWPRLLLRWARTAVHEFPRRLRLTLLLRDYARAGVPGLLRTMGRARRHRLDQTVQQLSCPVHVVRGRRDRIAPARWLVELTGTGERRSHRSLAVGAHMVPQTHPRLVADEVRRLLTELVR